MSAEVEQSLLIVGERERLLEALQQALEQRYRVDVEIATSATAAEAAIAAAPDLVLLVGDAVGNGGSDVLQRFAASPMASVVPVVLLADEPHLDERLQALRFGAAAVIPRSASVDAIARQVVELMHEIPERSGQAFGELGETTLEEFIQLLGRELRSGILSVRGVSGEESQTVRLVLGEGRNVQQLIHDFVDRVGSLVNRAETLQYEFDERPTGSLQLVGAEEAQDAGANIEGLRVLIADSDPVRADTIAQDLRGRGATAVIADLQGRRLERLRNTDPSVLIIGEKELRGPGYELIRTMREDPRLRWAFLLVVSWDQIWSDSAPRPTTDKLVARLAKLAESERVLHRRASDGKSFDTRLEVLGPARLLRTLAAVPLSLRVTVRHRRGNVTVDLTDGLVVGAQSAFVGEATTEGPSALARLLPMGAARVRIEPVEHPASTNLMSTPDVAFDMAEAEASGSKRPSRPGPQVPAGIRHVASAKTGLTERPPAATAAAQPDPPPRAPTPAKSAPAHDAPEPSPSRAAPPAPPPVQRSAKAAAEPGARWRKKTWSYAPSAGAPPRSADASARGKGEAVSAQRTAEAAPKQAEGAKATASETPVSDGASAAREAAPPQPGSASATAAADAATAPPQPGSASATAAADAATALPLEGTHPAAPSAGGGSKPAAIHRRLPVLVAVAAAGVVLLGLLVVGGGVLLWVLAGSSDDAQAAAAPPSKPEPDRGREVTANEPAIEEEQAAQPPRDAGGTAAAAHRAPQGDEPAEQTSAADDDGSGSDDADEDHEAEPDAPSRAGIEEHVIGEQDIPEHIRQLGPAARRRRAVRLRRLASQLTKRRAYKRAEKQWERAWWHDPTSASTAAGYARMLVAAGRHEEGLAWGRKALELNPDSGRYKAAMGELLFSMDDLDGAIDYYAQAAERRPHDRRVQKRLQHLRRVRDED